MSTHRSGEQFLLAAQDLAPLISEARDEIERTRLLPLALISAMEEAHIFRMWLPRRFGGPELSIAEFVRVVEALSYMDGSVGWCAGLGAAYSRFAAYLPEAVANRIFDGNIMAGSLAPMGRGMKVEGGYRVTGRWAWGSGIMHSNWILVTFLTQVGDEPILINEKPEMRLGFLPKSQDVEIIDTWKVGGMRGTGSHDYALSDVFIPDDYTLEGLDPPPLHPGSLYAVSLNSVYPFVIAAVPLGIALASFDAFLSLARVKTPVSGSVVLRDKPTVQAMVGRSHALLQSAREFYYATARSMPHWAKSGAPLTLDQRAQVRLAVAQIGDVSKQVVRDLVDLSGGSSVYETCPLERHLRDVHAATQHVQVSPNNFEFAGRVILGLDPGTARF
jgi:alkylation response protein AidB-like acyl-CoA dehydrogenase